MLAGIAAPVSLLEQCAGQGQYHLALAHLVLESEDYRLFYHAESYRKGVVLGVDNGVVEAGESLPLPRVVQAALAINATELVLPDVIGDGNASLYATFQGLAEYKQMGRPGDLALMAVPHGSTAREWMRCYLALLDCKDFDIIGISMFDSDLFSGGRVGLLDMLEDLGLIDEVRPYHMLGCWKDPREAYGLSCSSNGHEHSYGWYRAKREYVRSMDTGLPVRWGLQGLRCPAIDDLDDPPEATHRKADFLTPVDATEEVMYNIALYKAFCKGG